MNTPPPSPTRELLRIVHPWALLACILTYSLGAGIAKYLGIAIHWQAYLAGQAAMLTLLLSSYFLREYFDRSPLSDPIRKPGDPPRLTRLNLLQISATTLTIGAVLTVLLLAGHALTLSGFLVLGLSFFLTLADAVPPLRLARSGYGELVLAFFLANLTPVLAFLLQAGELHRLLALITFPLTFLTLASLLALRLPAYAADLREERLNMLTRLGWQRGMNLHNLLILGGYFLLGSAALAGLPWALTWPGLLGLPIGLFQIFLITSIGNGARPRWKLLTVVAASTFALTIYFLNLALWSG
ncbi:MAG TPA: prenyltransferase [Anaerolinea thermolimosa]|uniref:Prenyltransferase n=1 Tax=Anaerolinea thermolimosa TaxID=229919 RepID=A0A3D1JJN7_9CHLR|nr:prenyltransferase [Anaerolinea thermolimosa]GAP05483.1 1,4-dihydroxy-2-naphthoate prenyltransferase [Anaerolinea thermolimosa]HCE18445.1 prenyltransferase [Anaerolinea thermolimosa]